MCSLFKIRTHLLIGLLALSFIGCDSKEDVSAPEIQNVQLVSTANFGDSIEFKVQATSAAPLQSVTAALIYDGEVATSTTLRLANEDGIYAGKLAVPMKKNVVDGNYDVLVLAFNAVSQHSEQTFSLACSHPDYSYLTFVSTSGESYRFERTAKYEYEYTGDLPGILSGYFISPATNGLPEVTWGQSGSSIVAGSTSSINLVSSDEEQLRNVTLKFNMLSFATDVPLLPATFKFKNDGSSVTKTLKKGQSIYFEGTPDNCWIDVDFFTKADDGGYIFNAEDGSYKLTREDSFGFVRVERMNGNDYATYSDNGAQDALWCIGGEGYGKPDTKFNIGWNTSYGLCMAKVDENIFQLTIKLKLGFSIKFFYQKGWGGEFGGSDYSVVDTPFFGKTSAGNMQQMDDNNYLATQYTNDDKFYRITIDVSGGKGNIKLTCVEL
jgi:hypothetical protein